MKKLFVLTCTILFALAVQAQEHMAFKGVSMNCTLSSFVSQLTTKGYTKLYMNDRGAVLSGDFAGKQDCKIIVLSTSSSKVVWKVAVQFPEKVSWRSLKTEYETLKESYTEKYGNPETFEFFSTPYYEGDGYELQALSLEKCTYTSFFSSPQGNICLKITNDKCVQVGYEDAINVKIRENEKNKVVSDDI